MTIWEIFIIAISLSMDALAVSICKGLSKEKILIREAVITGLYFGIAQAVMPLLGYLLGSTFSSYITSFDHWIAFILLSIIGINMIRESFENDEKLEEENHFSFKAMFPLAIATSIDALAVGITFSFFDINIFIAITIIGLTTFTLSYFGVKLGSKLGEKFKKNAERLGGLVLIIMGIRILVTHMMEA